MATYFYFIRHGESLSNDKGEFTGQLDYPLSKTGKIQAEKLVDYFSDKKVDFVFSSDLSRAYETGKVIADLKNLSVEKDKALREIYAGAWEGKKFDDLETEYENDYSVWKKDIGNSVTTGGESVVEVGERVFGAVKRIAESHPDSVIAVATHATPIRVIESISRFGSPRFAKNVKWVENASVSKYSFENGKLDLIYRSDVSHLGALITSLPKNC